ncbi:hypothetical protein AOQ84DRAFT_384396 [Glonium stellatum]|uniref:Transmembrane protein n=1 Tax=Glonium stellatum TaxID=574774 RepID=A0A8E2FDB7_9PEZI|nr:hypothetical protein AOQ84DRAFT_384396 [Glonium stellatum]
MKRSFVLLAVCALLPLFVLAQDTTVHSTQTVQVTHTATLAAASAAATTQPADQGYNGGSDNPVDPNTAGASGSSSGAFSLSKGALAAIITVVVLVVVGGIASVTLFYLAKKRQWDVRQSFRRASRRLTGRSDITKINRQTRRTGVRMASPPPSSKNMLRDIEKGAPASGEKGRTTTTITSTFEVETPVAKSWTSKFFGSKK